MNKSESVLEYSWVLLVGVFFVSVCHRPEACVPVGVVPGAPGAPKFDDFWVLEISFHGYIDTKLGLPHQQHRCLRNGRPSKHR